ncbi:unnamed protein product [Penicillium olsonii]|nr:unnamed protein product [Penicillium olsonii]CAG7927362.1 unnamed protein product [Penicillium olsonii]
MMKVPLMKLKEVRTKFLRRAPSYTVCNPLTPSDIPNLTIFKGIVPTKIVGVRFYKGHANPGERVFVRRDPYNQYDRNAVKVENVMGAQIGHLPRQMAERIAPFMVNMSGPHSLDVIDRTRIPVNSSLKGL